MTATRMKFAVLHCLAFIGAMCAFGGGGQVWYLKTGDSSNNQAFTTANRWKDADGNPQEAFSTEDDYYACAFMRLSQASAFQGGSLHIGSLEEDKTGSASIYSGNLKIVSGSRGFFLEKGTITQNRSTEGSSLGMSGGPVAVLSPVANPFLFNASYNRSTLTVSGAVSGEDTTGIRLSGGAKTSIGYTFEDVSAYKGLMIVSSTVDRASSSTGVTLTLKNTSFPGGVDMGCKTILTAGGDAAGAEMSIGNMVLRDGSRVVIGGTASAHSVFRATGSLSAEKGVEIYLDFEVPISYETNTLVLLSAPIGAADFTKDDFVLNASKSDWKQRYFLDTPVADGVKSLVVVFEPLVRQSKSCSYEYEFRGDSSYRASSMEDATHWSDGLLPHGGAHYWTSTSLRTPYAPTETDVFPGLDLTLQGGSLRVFNAAYTVKNLIAKEGCILQTGSNGATEKTIHCDRIDVLADSTLNLETYSGTGMEIDSEIAGAGNLCFRGISRQQMTTAPQGHYTLRIPNDDFMGTICVSQYIGGSSTYGNFNTKFQALRIQDGRCLGGVLPELDPAALTLAGYSRLQILGPKVTLAAERNRGIYIQMCGRIYVDQTEGVDDVCVCDWPLTMNGAFYKEGEGRLELGGTVSFQGEDAIGDVPRANSNLFFVSAGTLVPRRYNCCDGLAMEFAKGTKLVIPVDPSNVDLAKYGLYNVKEGGSVTINDTLAVDFDLSASAEPPATEFSVGLLTVPKDAVGNVRGKLAVNKHPYPRFKAEIVEVPDDEHDAVIFTASIRQTGLMLLFR